MQHSPHMLFQLRLQCHGPFESLDRMTSKQETCNLQRYSGVWGSCPCYWRHFLAVEADSLGGCLAAPGSLPAAYVTRVAARALVFWDLYA